MRKPRLTRAQRDEIRHRLTLGERQVDLASEYNVTQSAISRIKNFHIN